MLKRPEVTAAVPKRLERRTPGFSARFRKTGWVWVARAFVGI